PGVPGRGRARDRRLRALVRDRRGGRRLPAPPVHARSGAQAGGARRGRARGLPRLPASAAGAALAPLPHRPRLPRRRHAAERRGRGRRRDLRARLTVLGLYGGAFDPPHKGHVELARVAKDELGLDRLLVLVSADPGHKRVETPAATRLELARAAFPDDEVALDEHARTIDMLCAHPEWHDPLFLIGADEFCDFLSWKEPDEVLRRT